jgi:formylglycine-generating enzyme
MGGIMAQVFISYSRSDILFIDELIPLLKQVFKHHDFWYDQHITGGEDWWQTILEAINASDVFIYLLSNDSIASEYCQAEFREALRLQKICLPILVRPKTNVELAPDDLKPEIKRRNWVDMSGGFKDFKANARLYAALNEHIDRIPAQIPAPITRTVTPKPYVPVKPTRERNPQVTIAIVTGIFVLLAAIIGIVPPLLQQSRDAAATQNADNTFVAQTQVAIASAVTSAPTESPTTAITPTATDTPQPLNATEIEQSVTAEMQKIATEAAQTAIANATGTMVIATAQAQQTRYALETAYANETATAVLWTATATPDIRASAEARFTLDAVATQNAIDSTGTQQAIIDAYTDTPAPTQTPTLTPLGIAIQRARAKTNSNAEWQNPYPEGFVQEFDGVPMVLVPSGCFTIGSEVHGEDEKNGNQICFYVPFWLDQTEVTQADFARLEGEKAIDNYFDGANRPVENITWFEAQAFCEQREGRLPTEAEWEYAARGPDELIYPWGNDWNENNVVWNRNDSSGTVDVKSIASAVSWVGAFDLSGNVWEWMLSEYKVYPYDKNDGREENLSSGTVQRVSRGGSWYSDNPDFLRSSSRTNNPSSAAGTNVGFRCARLLS